MHVALISLSSFMGHVRSYFDSALRTDRASAYMNCVLKSVAKTKARQGHQERDMAQHEQGLPLIFVSRNGTDRFVAAGVLQGEALREDDAFHAEH